jgi:hypothetical protein
LRLQHCILGQPLERAVIQLAEPYMAVLKRREKRKWGDHTLGGL